MRAAAISLLVAVAAFLLLVARSIALYPGGTWFDASAVGHDMLRNFLCDLTQPIALNGAVHRGAPYAIAAMLVLDVGLLLVWLTIPSLTDPSPLAPSPLAPLARWLRIAGIASFVGIVAVPLTPSLRLGLVHAAAVLTGVVPGIAAGVLANVMLARSRHRTLHRLGFVILVGSAVDAVLYLHHVLFAGPPVVALPALQRAVLALLLTWMTAIAVTILREPHRWSA